jgi:hypothetical protein
MLCQSYLATSIAQRRFGCFACFVLFDRLWIVSRCKRLLCLAAVATLSARTLLSLTTFPGIETPASQVISKGFPLNRPEPVAMSVAAARAELINAVSGCHG